MAEMPIWVGFCFGDKQIFWIFRSREVFGGKLRWIFRENFDLKSGRWFFEQIFA